MLVRWLPVQVPQPPSTETRMERRPLHVLQARPQMMVQEQAQVVAARHWQECLGLARGLTRMRLGTRPL